MSGLPEHLREAAHRWAEETALAQGLPARVERPDVLRDVAVLLRSGEPAHPSGPPHGRQPRLVEPVEAPPGWTDDDMLDDSGNDLLLAR